MYLSALPPTRPKPPPLQAIDCEGGSAWREVGSLPHVCVCLCVGVHVCACLCVCVLERNFCIIDYLYMWMVKFSLCDWITVLYIDFFNTEHPVTITRCERCDLKQVACIQTLSRIKDSNSLWTKILSKIIAVVSRVNWCVPKDMYIDKYFINMHKCMTD